MPKALPEAELLIIGVGSPLLAGLYIDGELAERFEKEGKSSKVLPPILHDLRYRYRLKNLYYVRGPGSFMAIKVVYVMLKTFSIALDIPLYAADAFTLNGGAPIKAVGRSRFVKRGDEIAVEPGEATTESSFTLPARIDAVKWSRENEPLYILPAV